MFAPPLMAINVRSVQHLARHVLLDARNRQRAGRLRNGAGILENVLDRRADLVRGHQHDFVDVLPGQPEGFLAHAPHRNAVGEDADALEGDALAGAQRLVHSGRVFGLHADDLDARIQRLRVGRDAADQSAAADGHEDRVDTVAVRLAQDFHGDRALAGDHVRIVERMHEDQPALARELDGALIGLVVLIAVQHDFGAQIGDRLHLDVGRRQRHDDDRRNAASARAERHTLGMVAGRCADHAALRADRRQLGDLVVGAANFERKHRLEVFTLEEHAIVEAARKAGCRFQRGLDGDVIYLGFEDSFYVIFLHGLLGLHAAYISSSDCPRVCLP